MPALYPPGLADDSSQSWLPTTRESASSTRSAVNKSTVSESGFSPLSDHFPLTSICPLPLLTFLTRSTACRNNHHSEGTRSDHARGSSPSTSGLWPRCVDATEVPRNDSAQLHAVAREWSNQQRGLAPDLEARAQGSTGGRPLITAVLSGWLQ